MSNVEVIENETPAETLDLIVTEKAVGFLNTNIAQLEVLVDKRLEDYKPEKYKGDADLAKKDRAELNRASDQIKRSRINLINELMKPYQDFEERCKNLEKKIASASKALDEIVKLKESEEKDKKRKQIEVFWQTKNFNLFPLEKIFNEKWLNKTYKESDILSEMDAVIDRTYKDLKTIERFSEDSDTLKAHYLMNLDIAETIQYGDELQRQREIAAREAKEREEREHQKQMEQQKEELWDEAVHFEEKQDLSNLAEMALSESDEPVKPKRKEFVVTVRCFDAELLKLKEAMNELGIEFSVEELKF